MRAQTIRMEQSLYAEESGGRPAIKAYGAAQPVSLCAQVFALGMAIQSSDTKRLPRTAYLLPPHPPPAHPAFRPAKAFFLVNRLSSSCDSATNCLLPPWSTLLIAKHHHGVVCRQFSPLFELFMWRHQNMCRGQLASELLVVTETVSTIRLILLGFHAWTPMRQWSAGVLHKHALP